MESVLYGFHVVLMASVWAGVVLFPGQAIQAVASPVPWQIEGVLPHLPSNAVGLLGVLLALWSLGRLLSANEPGARWVSLVMAFLGVVTLVAAQYRTGYLALVVGVAILLALRGKLVLALGVALLLVVGVGYGLMEEENVQGAVLRGQTTEEASRLSSRIEWWNLALPVWRESPIIGKGLLTATRFEVFAAAGRETTSTIHSTWVEALLGTGIVGLGLLVTAFLLVAGKSIAEALRPGGRVVPLLVLTVLGVRSFTGTTFEASGRSLLLFLTFALALYYTSMRTLPTARGPGIAATGGREDAAREQ